MKRVAVDGEQSELRGMLCRCCNSDSSGWHDFLAHQILADVEELFEDPFGPVVPDVVVAGHGGQLGFLMLKNHIGAPLNFHRHCNE